MGLIECCLMSLFAQQGPGEVPPPAEAPAVSVASEVAAGARLAQLEEAGQYADATTLTELALCPEEDVAARAAWILATSNNEAHWAALPAVVEQSAHAAARLQAMQGIAEHGDISATGTAIRALDDDDLRVRTVAVQLLGHLRRPAAVEPLLHLIRSWDGSRRDEAPTDVQAALVTLADLGAAQHLLRVADDVTHAQVPDCGAALAYTFQELSPRLPPMHLDLAFYRD